MSEQVKALTDVVRDLSMIKELAPSVAAELRKNLDDTVELLHMTRDVAKALGAARAELQSALGINTNSPPAPKPGED